MKKYLLLSKNKYLLVMLVFTLAGLMGGYLYYIFIGCTSNGCAITSNPYMSLLWGGLIGYLLFTIIFSLKKDKLNQ